MLDDLNFVPSAYGNLYGMLSRTPANIRDILARESTIDELFENNREMYIWTQMSHVPRYLCSMPTAPVVKLLDVVHVRSKSTTPGTKPLLFDATIQELAEWYSMSKLETVSRVTESLDTEPEDVQYMVPKTKDEAFQAYEKLQRLTEFLSTVAVTSTDARPNNIVLSRNPSDNGLKMKWIDMWQFLPPHSSEMPLKRKGILNYERLCPLRSPGPRE
jgi:hypothetical protein